MRKKIVMFLILFISMTFICNVKAIDTFECKLGDYTLIYNTKGAIQKITKGSNEITKNIESFFEPKNQTECPTSSDAKVSIIDGGRTYYVAKIDEFEPSEPNASSCFSFDETSCESSKKIACVWNETKYGNYCNTDNLLYVSCGNARDIPYQVPQLVSFAVNFLKIATPIILIIVSIISLVKALAASKEDEIKKATQSLIKKLIAAVMVFFIISIVQFVILKVADKSENGSVTDCMSCLLNNDCGSNAYYKTNVGGTYICKDFKGNVFYCINNEKTSVSSTSNNADNKMSGGGSNF